ncbi:MAG: 4-hydroxy-tetrahydrodipicolinate reductase [Oscillospiraceae bacterium]|nr:4-hydroxy-tetrahydrodipicolinate reductase [Oscillospiraceae bacterium]
MKKVILCGALGNMGKTTAEVASLREDIGIILGVDKEEVLLEDFSVVDNFSKVKKQADVLIDFSHSSVLNDLLEFCIKNKVPLVSCTTGLTKSLEEKIKRASRIIPVFRSENMSISMNFVIKICKLAAKSLENFDIEIVERHHNQKLDAPSGTALILANTMSEAKKNKRTYVYDRHEEQKKRQANEIGISSVRGGTIAGDHEIMYAGRYETLSIRHVAQSRKVFAVGAINAAIFLADKSPGFYDMSDLFG